MQVITRSKVHGRLAAIAIVAALAVCAVAQNQARFKGTMHGSDADGEFTGTTLTVYTIGSGVGTELGQFSFSQTNFLDVTNGHDAGTARFIAANKDSLTTAFSGSGHPTAPNEFDIEEDHIITGGTGRFAGAHGGFKVTRHASGNTFLTSGTFEGTITPPGATH